MPRSASASSTHCSTPGYRPGRGAGWVVDIQYAVPERAFIFRTMSDYATGHTKRAEFTIHFGSGNSALTLATLAAALFRTPFRA